MGEISLHPVSEAFIGIPSQPNYGSAANAGAEVRVLLRICCWACGNARDVLLSSGEHSLLLHEGMISRHCETCSASTRWRSDDHVDV